MKDTRITIRMSAELREKLQVQANRNDQSLAQRIVEVCAKATRGESPRAPA